ncbi:hypothetical protein L8S96_06400 [Enterobacter roggenkampii]|uniref:hypothetical protein n=1 Tax=Enterobacter cloacae complex TaxID=354276 RepID=UPI00200588AD|nr:hypothetical protein [Enterobacter roggenkampii]MCK6671532.1 hypothetical protein [Enterobacter roggenkampii]
MITFTKEQLIASAHARIEFAEMMLAGELEPLKERTWSIELELARIALASLEAEPVAYVDPFAFNNFSVYRAGETDNKRMGREWMWANPDAGLIPVYTAPPAPVSVPDTATPQSMRAMFCQLDDSECAIAADVWNACRAAMLHGADGNSPVIPDWQAQAEKMAELYGSSFVLFRDGESPQCADPSKVIISFTDEGLGHGAAAPQQEAE